MCDPNSDSELSDWFNNAGPYGGTEQTDMKEALRSGDAATLNLYSVG